MSGALSNCIIDCTYIGELKNAHLSEIGKTIMSRILVQNQGDILHRFGAEPLRHC